MITTRSRVPALFVDRTTGQWVGRCPEGKSLVLPGEDSLWETRRPFEQVPDTDLEPVFWYYKDMPGLPF
jgi:hypothetical protein